MRSSTFLSLFGGTFGGLVNEILPADRPPQGLGTLRHKSRMGVQPGSAGGSVGAAVGAGALVGLVAGAGVGAGLVVADATGEGTLDAIAVTVGVDTGSGRAATAVPPGNTPTDGLVGRTATAGAVLASNGPVMMSSVG